MNADTWFRLVWWEQRRRDNVERLIRDDPPIYPRYDQLGRASRPAPDSQLHPETVRIPSMHRITGRCRRGRSTT